MKHAYASEKIQETFMRDQFRKDFWCSYDDKTMTSHLNSGEDEEQGMADLTCITFCNKGMLLTFLSLDQLRTMTVLRLID
jgi:hypothetical protein